MLFRNIRDHKRLVEEEMDLLGLEFTNLEFCALEQCHPSTRSDYLARLAEVYEMSDYLARLPEVYKVTTSLILWGANISPCTTDVEREEDEESLPSMTVAQLPPMPSMPILATRADSPTNSTPVVKVPDKSPACPCCGNQIETMLELIDNLKRPHGSKKILFQQTNVKHNSTTCHFTKCKGAVESALMEGRSCGECSRVFETKISLTQRNRLAHPMAKNVEQILASCRKTHILTGIAQQFGKLGSKDITNCVTDWLRKLKRIG